MAFLWGDEMRMVAAVVVMVVVTPSRHVFWDLFLLLRLFWSLCSAFLPTLVHISVSLSAAECLSSGCSSFLF